MTLFYIVILYIICETFKQLQNAGSMDITLWDAHFDYEDIPELPVSV